MRCYTLTNMYITGIHVGIQSAHAITEMFNDSIEAHQNMLYNWSDNHKTIVALNGGMNKSMCEMAEFFDNKDNPFPYATFNESEEALDGILTSIAIVLPQNIYEGIRFRNRYSRTYFHKKDDGRFDLNCGTPSAKLPDACQCYYTQYEVDLINKLKGLRLAT